MRPSMPMVCLRQNGKAETLGYAIDLLRRDAGGELEYHFVRRKPRFANWRHARTGRQRNDRHVNETRAGRGAIAALHPVGEAARVSRATATLPPGDAGRTRTATLSPPTATAVRATAGWPKAVWKLKPAAIGREGLRVAAKAGIDRTSQSQPTMACPDICAISRRHGDLHLAQLDAVGRDIDGLQSCG